MELGMIIKRELDLFRLHGWTAEKIMELTLYKNHAELLRRLATKYVNNSINK